MRHDYNSVVWLRDLRHKMINRLLGGVAVIGLPGIIYSLWRIWNGSGDVQATVAYIGAYIFLIILFYGRQISDYWRSLGILLAIYLFAAFCFYLGWLESGGRVFLMALIVAASILIGSRAGWIAALLSFLTFWGFGLVYNQGWMALRPINPPQTWTAIIIEGLGFAIAIGITMASLNFFRQALNAEADARRVASETQFLLEQRAEELHQANQLLDDRTRSAESTREKMENQARLSASIALLSQAISGEQDVPTLADRVIRHLCHELNVPLGGLFIANEEGVLQLTGSYAYLYRDQFAASFSPGVGLVGQAALEKRMFTLRKPPSGYHPVLSGLVELEPIAIVVAPFLYDQKVIGVIELTLLQPFTPLQIEFLNGTLNSIAVAFHTARTRAQVNLLLRQTQEQAAALKAREEMLQRVNAELQAQTENLRASQIQLQEQQSALEESNAELVEQRSVLDLQNQEMKVAQQELQRKTEELIRANKYKSEFLANMSHELRTPLNSLLILARILKDNESGNLTDEQVESAAIIHNSGKDLLALINEILDLSKVEAGRAVFHISIIRPAELANNMRALFAAHAREKNLDFDIELAADLPESFESDQQRVEQILKNLLGNALKFTEKGHVSLKFESAAHQIAMHVSDSGIGMTPEQQQRVFQAFQQADGSTSRKYGGTGLGLTISRNLAANLGGSIVVTSELGRGSTFTLYLPLKSPAGKVQADGSTPAANPVPEIEARLAETEARFLRAEERPKARLNAASGASPLPATPVLAAPPFPDDRAAIRPGDRIVLVIEDDPQFARLLYDYSVQKGYKCLAALDGDSGIEHVRQFQPDAILLDLKLPGRSGWEVLDQLKHTPELRHIPVHVLSGAEGSPADATLVAMRQGAVGFISKPVTMGDLDQVFEEINRFLARDLKTLLIVEDDVRMRQSMRKLLRRSEVKIFDAETGRAALDWLSKQHFDCMILDLSLPDMTGFDVLRQINERKDLNRCPVIVYTGRSLTAEESAELHKYTDSVIVKGSRSPEKLLNNVDSFLHHVNARLEQEKRPPVVSLDASETVLTGKKILVVDDDMRNAFAMRHLLKEKKMEVGIASSGAKALEMLDSPKRYDLVLMDVMMPEMDGYETIQRIRAQDGFERLPIIALTAKAMPEDREKCLAVGASEYISKPVNTDRLIALLRIFFKSVM